MLERLWKRKSQPLIGLDIGSNSAKAVMLSREQDKLMVTHAEIVSIPAGAVVEHEIRDFEAVGNALKPLIHRLGKRNTLVAAAVAGSSVITKVIFVDGNSSDADLEAQVQIEADHLIPFPLEEVSLDFEVIPSAKADVNRQSILLSACRTEHVESRIAALETAGYTPKVIDIEAFALTRTLPLMASLLPDTLDDKIVAMVDIGASMLLFTVVRNGETIYNREQPFGGGQFNQAISGYYGLTPEEAEQAKLNGELPDGYELDVLIPFQTQLIQQVRRNVQIFSTSSGHSELDYLLVSGGSAILPGTVELLRDELSIHAILAQPFVDMDIAANVDSEQLKASAHQFTLACGLALRCESAHGKY